MRASERPLRASIRVKKPERGATTTLSLRPAIDPLSPATTIGSRRTCVAVLNVGSIRSTVRDVSVGPEPTTQTFPAEAARLCAATVSGTEAMTRLDAGEIRRTEWTSGDETQSEPAA